MTFKITDHAVSVPRLRERLFGDTRYIPKTAIGDYVAIGLVTTRQHPIGTFRLTVTPHVPHEPDQYGRVKKSSRHRIFVKCSCGREIPVGRLHQHVHHVPDYTADYLTEVMGVPMADYQALALNRICQRYGKLPTLSLEFGRNPALMCDFGTIVIGIEPDGYSHS